MLSILITFVVLSIVYNYFYKILCTDIPIFPGCLPIVGHIFELNKPDIFNKMATVAKTTPIFKLNLFLKDVAVIVDPNMLKQYFKATEKEMSMYDVLKGLYFWEALSDNPIAFSKIIHIIRKSLMMDMKKYIKIIVEEATYEITQMPNSNVDVLEVCKKYVANTSSKCFLGRRLTSDEYDTLREFSNLFNFIIVITYFLPHRIIRLIWGSKLRDLRYKLRKSFYPDIQKFIDGTNMEESAIMKFSLDTQNDEISNAEKLENTGDIIVSLLYVATENTALGISNTIYDIITHKEVFDSLFDQYCTDEEIITNETIDNIIWETARTNSHMFSINRAFGTEDVFNGYDISNVNSLVISNQVMMMYGNEAKIKFPDPLKYNPDRFIGNERLKSSKHIITWGDGVHGCIGRLFAQYETKIFIYKLFTRSYNPKIVTDGKINYFSPSAYAERKYLANFNHSSNIDEIPLANGNTIYVMRNFVTPKEQQEIFNDLCNVKKRITKSGEYAILKYHNLVYTGTSNCEYKEYPFINKITKISIMLENAKLNSTCLSLIKNFNPNSTYASLMKNGMPDHYDKYVDLGISLSLGANALFKIHDKTFILHSGDIVLANFGVLKHGVHKIYKKTKPTWFNVDGFYRASLQIREVKNYPDKLMTIDEFAEMQ
jgi:cytochrome P450